MGQQSVWLLLLLWSLLCLHGQGFPVRRAKRTLENAEYVDNSVVSTEATHLSSSKKEESEMNGGNIVNELVVLLKDTVEKVPTPRPSEETPAITFHLWPDLSVTSDTIWAYHKLKKGEEQAQESQADYLTDETTETTTPFWKLRNDSAATIILHTTTTPSTKTTPEHLQSESSATGDFLSDNTISETPTATASFLLEKADTTVGEGKTFSQLTKRTLSNLVESLKKIEEVHSTLHDATDKLQQESKQEKLTEGLQHKPEDARHLELIYGMRKTIRNSPPSVKNDPALHNNVEKAARLLQADLKLVAEAQKRLKEAQQLKEKERQASSSLLPNLPGPEITISLMPASSNQKQDQQREQQSSPSPAPHWTGSDITILVEPVSSGEEQETK